MTKLRAILFCSVVLALACGDNMGLESGVPDAGLGTVPGDEPDDDVGDEPVEDDEEDEGGGLACTLEELEPILTCALEECLDLGEGLPGLPGGEGGEGGFPGLPGGEGGGFDLGELLSCTAISCFPEILGVSSECSACLFELIGGGENALEVCGGDLGDLGGIPGLPGGGEGGEGGIPELPF